MGSTEQWICPCRYMNVGPICTHCGAPRITKGPQPGCDSLGACRARSKAGAPPCDGHCPRSLDAVVMIVLAALLAVELVKAFSEILAWLL